MKISIEVLETALKQSKEQEKIIQARLDRGESVQKNEKNMLETKHEIQDLESSISILYKNS